MSFPQNQSTGGGSGRMKVSVATDTVRETDPTEYTLATQNTSVLIYKFIPKYLGEVKLKIDSTTSAASAAATFGLNTATGTIGFAASTTSTFYQTPLGTVTGTATVGSSVALTSTTSTTYVTLSIVVTVYNLAPIYIVAVCPNAVVTTTKYKNVSICYDLI